MIKIASKHKAFILIFGIANLGLVLYGTLALTMPGVLLESFSRHVYQFSTQEIIAMEYLAALSRLLGFLNLLLGVAGLYLLWRYHRDGQDWQAQFVMVISLLAYLGPIVFDNTVGNIGFFEIVEHFIFIAMVLFGILFIINKCSHISI